MAYVRVMLLTMDEESSSSRVQQSLSFEEEEEEEEEEKEANLEAEKSSINCPKPQKEDGDSYEPVAVEKEQIVYHDPFTIMVIFLAESPKL
ncbi:unnamed protein product [Linum trigynum]|uniref:Uncharacterized protein n=1 Tax=Linum trigynum TaxID=586398 RepID=A0AAV2CKJ6_9ROSI